MENIKEIIKEVWKKIPDKSQTKYVIDVIKSGNTSEFLDVDGFYKSQYKWISHLTTFNLNDSINITIKNSKKPIDIVKLQKDIELCGRGNVKTIIDTIMSYKEKHVFLIDRFLNAFKQEDLLSMLGVNKYIKFIRKLNLRNDTENFPHYIHTQIKSIIILPSAYLLHAVQTTSDINQKKELVEFYVNEIFKDKNTREFLDIYQELYFADTENMILKKYLFLLSKVNHRYMETLYDYIPEILSNLETFIQDENVIENNILDKSFFKRVLHSWILIPLPYQSVESSLKFFNIIRNNKISKFDNEHPNETLSIKLEIISEIPLINANDNYIVECLNYGEIIEIK